MAEIDDLRELAKLAREEGDEELELRALERLDSLMNQKPSQPLITGEVVGGRSRSQQEVLSSEGSLVDAIAEPIAAIASGVAAEPLAGLAGLATGDADMVQRTRDALTFDPRTERGQEGLEFVAGLIQRGVDLARIPISGLGGIAELVAGQGIDQAAQTIRNIQEEGVGKTLGSRTMDATGSPVLATIAETIPTAATSALGLKTKPGPGPRISAERGAEIDQVVEAGERFNIPVTTTDVIPLETAAARLGSQFSERIPILGTGKLRAEQYSARIKAIEDLDASTPEVSPEVIFNSLKQNAANEKRAAGKRLGLVIDEMDATGVKVPLDNSNKALDEVIAFFNRPGEIKNEALISELDKLKSTLNETPRDFTSLRRYRTQLRNNLEKKDVGGNPLIQSQDQVQLNKLIKGVTKDLDRFIVNNSGVEKLRAYKKDDRIYAEEIRSLKKSRLKNIIETGDIEPEKINRLLFNSNKSQVELLYNNLDDVGRNHAKNALLKNALDKANGSPKKFVNMLNRNDKSFKVFFRGDNRAEVEGLKRLLEHTSRADDAAVITPTGQSLQFGSGVVASAAAISQNPIAVLSAIMGGSVAAGSRIYETSGVRRLLVRLGKSPRRKELEADLLVALPALIETTQQALESKQENK